VADLSPLPRLEDNLEATWNRLETNSARLDRMEDCLSGLKEDMHAVKEDVGHIKPTFQKLEPAAGDIAYIKETLDRMPWFLPVVGLGIVIGNGLVQYLLENL